ncbi:hypothetical protein B0H17DRAFT_1198939 [Mycena rosella]|uniref:RNase III domain-containing protein n=1 Tax=Mycena rosella TaxID=1033263 RepID=A0AAD7GK81_MYCRO|nr:hypothetical protein B0H17DRAFT_1198939 [Mycena rosella]
MLSRSMIVHVVAARISQGNYWPYLLEAPQEEWDKALLNPVYLKSLETLGDSKLEEVVVMLLIMVLPEASTELRTLIKEVLVSNAVFFRLLVLAKVFKEGAYYKAPGNTFETGLGLWAIQNTSTHHELIAWRDIVFEPLALAVKDYINRMQVTMSFLPSSLDHWHRLDHPLTNSPPRDHLCRSQSLTLHDDRSRAHLRHHLPGRMEREHESPRPVRSHLRSGRRSRSSSHGSDHLHSYTREFSARPRSRSSIRVPALNPPHPAVLGCLASPHTCTPASPVPAPDPARPTTVSRLATARTRMRVTLVLAPDCARSAAVGRLANLRHSSLYLLTAQSRLHIDCTPRNRWITTAALAVDAHPRMRRILSAVTGDCAGGSSAPFEPAISAARALHTPQFPQYRRCHHCHPRAPRMHRIPSAVTGALLGDSSLHPETATSPARALHTRNSHNTAAAATAVRTHPACTAFLAQGQGLVRGTRPSILSPHLICKRSAPPAIAKIPPPLPLPSARAPHAPSPPRLHALCTPAIAKYRRPRACRPRVHRVHRIASAAMGDCGEDSSIAFEPSTSPPSALHAPQPPKYPRPRPRCLRAPCTY